MIDFDYLFSLKTLVSTLENNRYMLNKKYSDLCYNEKYILTRNKNMDLSYEKKITNYFYYYYYNDYLFVMKDIYTNIPKLYIYQPVSDLTEDYILNSLKKQYLFFNDVKNFNDKSEFNNLYFNENELYSKYKEKKELIDSFKKSRNQIFCCCLTENNPCNISKMVDYMWENYAKNDGICIEVDMGNNQNLLKYLKPVKYTECRIDVNGLLDSILALKLNELENKLFIDVFQSSLATKLKQDNENNWSQERERRLLIDEDKWTEESNNKFILNFDTKTQKNQHYVKYKPNRVFYSNKMNLKKLNRLKNITDDLHIELVKVERN